MLNGAGKLRLPVDKQHAEFLPIFRAPSAARCSMVVESLPPENEMQIREKFSNTHCIRC